MHRWLYFLGAKLVLQVRLLHQSLQSCHVSGFGLNGLEE